jgi:hypothetical protein
VPAGGGRQPKIGNFCFFILVMVAAARLHAAPLPAELTAALANFRSEGPKGWSFTQTTRLDGESLVEYFDAARPEDYRWTLRQKNGRPPTGEELADYNQEKAPHSGAFTAPRIQDQFDLTTAVLVSHDDSHSVWRFLLKSGGDDDKTSRFMAVTVTFQQPTRTVERVEIANTAPFSPVLAVKISEVRTVMSYSLPSKESPSLLQQVTLHVRGRAFWFKSLDQDMTVTYSEHVWSGKK